MFCPSASDISSEKRNSSLVSIIIPAYNAETTLVRCLDSVLGQTHSCIEVIVVNDGSIDKTEQICADLSVQDTRIHYVTTENRGVSHARNIGIERCRGEFVLFVDADDYVEPVMAERLLSHISNTDIAVGSLFCEKQDGSRQRSLHINAGTFTGNELLEKLFTINWGTFCKLYRRDAIGKTRFDVSLAVSEDLVFNFDIFCKKVTAVFVDTPLYHWVEYPELKLSHNRHNKKRLDNMKCYDHIFNCVGTGFADKIRPHYINEIIRCMRFLLKYHDEYAEFAKLKQRLHPYLKKIVYEKRYSYGLKRSAVLYSLMPYSFLRFLNSGVLKGKAAFL